MSTETLGNTLCQDVQLVSAGRRAIVTRGQNGRVTSREFGGQWWILETIFKTLDRSQFDPILAFVARHREGGDFFRFSPPDLFGLPRGTIAGAPSAAGGEGVGVTAIATTGWTANQNGVLKERDFIRLPSDTKIYEVTADVNSNGSGAATINIWPPLIKTCTAGSIAASNPYFTVICLSQTDPVFSRDGYYSMGITLEEYF